MGKRKRLTAVVPKSIARLRSKAGESLAEVLIALLIAALALTMLASVINTTARIIRQSKASMTAYYTKESAFADTSEGDSMTITVSYGSDSLRLTGEAAALPVKYKESAVGNITIVAYQLQP